MVLFGILAALLSHSQTIGPVPSKMAELGGGHATPSQSGVDPCRRVGEGRFQSVHKDRCEGVWTIYGSFSDGGTWWHDKDGVDPQARQVRQRASALQARLLRCGIASHLSLSDWFDRFTPDLAVVHSPPFPDARLAAVALARARRCGVAGYTKFSELRIVGRD
jgi:hypothetical protein